VVSASRGRSGTARGGAGPARVKDSGEAAMARGKWRGGRGGDGEREVARRGTRRQPEGGGDEGRRRRRAIWGTRLAPGDLGEPAPALDN